MKWFEGAIPEAITLARSSKSIFLVYIEGADEQSKELSKSIDSSQISDKLTSTDFVAIRLQSSDSAAAQFSEIYPVVVVPSLYFIATDGSLLSIVAGKKESSDLVKEIDDNLQKHRQIVGSGPSSSGTSQPCSSKTIPASTAKPISTDGSVEIVQSPKVETPAATSVHVSDSNPSISDATMSIEEKTQSSSQEESQNLDDRVEYAKQLIAKKQVEKANEEKEKEKQKELERRKLGQDVQKSRAKRADEELKQLAKDRQRERQLEKEARDRVRQQIAQDRADRAAKWKSEKEADEIKAKEAKLEKMRQQAEAEKKTSEKNTSARLQIRLPDGSSHVLSFNVDDTLSSVRAHVVNNLSLPMRSFTFSQLIPRHQFTLEEEEQSLRQLELIPSAVLLVLPSQNNSTSVVAAAVSAPSDISSGLSGMFWSLLKPLFLIINFVKTFLFGAPSTRSIREDGREQDSSPQSSSSSSSRAYRRPRPETGVRREGKMMRLATADSDEDENTYNGNSTQQM